MNHEEINISEDLKNSYLYDMDIFNLLDLFLKLFEKEKHYLFDIMLKNKEQLYISLDFSKTLYNISDIIVHRFFYDKLNPLERCFITSSKFRGAPFKEKIEALKLNNHG